MHRSIKQSGAALISVLIVLPFLIFMTASFLSLTVSSFHLARRDQLRTHAQFGADAGIDYALYEINQDDTWNGTTGEVELHNTGNTRVTYQIAVNHIDSDNKTITATGRTYSPANAATPKSSLTLSTKLLAIRSGGNYSIVSGVGGLIMSNSSKVLGGDVHINGKVTLSNSAQIGLSTNPVNLSVAHMSCPSPPTAAYPRQCTTGENGQPITITNTARIYGSVKANNQTNGTAMSLPGLLTPHCTTPPNPPTGVNCVTPQPLPAHDRNAQKAAATNNLTAAAAGCSSGTRTWNADTKITGNVTISGSCKVTVNGNIWITGSLTMSNTSELIVANSLGTTRPIIMFDGDIATFRNSSILRSNSSSTGFEIIAYKSNAACSPDCADITGSDLFNSQTVTRIELDNSASGAKTVFYARWSKVLIKNSGQIGALIGQTVELSNSSTITFGTTAYVSGGAAKWIIDGYRRL